MGMLATGGKDKMVRIWDIRQPHQALEGLAGHAGDVTAVDWRSEPGLLASSSTDKRVFVWDPLRAGRAVDDGVVDRWHLCAKGKLEPQRSAFFKNVVKAENPDYPKDYPKQSRYAPELA